MQQRALFALILFLAANIGDATAKDIKQNPPAGSGMLCRVADPTGTPLNVRTIPSGKRIGDLANGTTVLVLDGLVERGKQWVFVEVEGENGIKGWVFKDYLDCSKPVPSDSGASAAHVKTFQLFSCSGTVGRYSTGIADQSIGGGDNMCYFVSQSPVGREILSTCTLGSQCRVVGTVKNDQEGGDWSPIITDVITVTRLR
jgi:hypothetical protein